MRHQSVSRFWDQYIQKTMAYKVKSGTARWYVRHAEQYLKAHADSRLSKHSPGHVETYLNAKGRNPHLKDWQFQQVVIALKILFVEMVKTSWANDFCWDNWVMQAKSLSINHSTEKRVSEHNSF